MACEGRQILCAATEQTLELLGDSGGDGQLMQGGDALCACGGHIFLASNAERAIWRLDANTLMPQAVFPGGPGMCAMCAGADGMRLYTLLGDADSVLMSDAGTGSALLLNRCGCNPRRMMLRGGLLVIAGGEDGCVHLLDDHTLEGRYCLRMPGPVHDVLAAQGRIHALCMTAELSALLVTQEAGMRHVLALDGMPGCLYAGADALLAATQGWLYQLTPDGLRIIRRHRAPGRCAQLLEAGGRVYALDILTEYLHVRHESLGWRCLRRGVKAIACAGQGQSCGSMGIHLQN